MKFTSDGCVLALIAHMDLEMHPMDVKTAFLSGDNDKDTYMGVAEGVSCDLKDHT